MEKEWVLYILECGDGTLYTGITDDLPRRFKAHSEGKGAKYTRGRGPLKLRYREVCGDHGAALRREWAVKQLSRAEKLRLLSSTELDLHSREERDILDIEVKSGNISGKNGGKEMKKERTLVVMAAGMGSRFAGGIKQLQPVGPCGEVLMEYSIYDALEAGFNRVIFIIRHDIEALFESTIGRRVRPACEKRGVEVLLAYQEKEQLPEGFVCPSDRQKPWGTGHALLSCKGMLHGGFTVLNADDYYGKDAYRKAIAFLDSLEEDSRDTYGLVGFSLGNTLSDNGGVTRGLCASDDEGWLTEIEETREIIKVPGGAAVDTENGRRLLDPAFPVSMNMWAFTPDLLDRFERRFVTFLHEHMDEPKSEFLIPSEIGRMLHEEPIRVKVLPTDSHWFGMTFAEDLPSVRDAFVRMQQEGIYDNPLR